MENNKKSDILMVLENIDRMLQCYTTMVNDIAGSMQMFAIAIEAQSLASKLNLAAERWRYKLPFKEACDVDFKFWRNRVVLWLSNFYDVAFDTDDSFEIDYFVPQSDYFVDLYSLELDKEMRKENNLSDDSYTPFYKIQDSRDFHSRVWELKRDFDRKREFVKESIDLSAIEELEEETTLENNDIYIESQTPISYKKNLEKKKTLLSSFFRDYFSEEAFICDNLGTDYLAKSLEELWKALRMADEALLCPEEATYKSLYERLSVAYFDKHIDEAKTSFQGWLSKTPKKKRLKMLKEKLEKEKANFFSGKWKEALENYFDIEKVLEGTDAGMFIFKYRQDLTLKEVGQIVGQYHKMACILEEISRLENKAEVKPVAKIAETPQETKIMELSPIFARGIRESATATNQIVEAIREIAVTTSTPDRKLSGGKTWGHVKEALCWMGVIDCNCLGTEFGRAIEAICPDKKHTNVEQALKRYNSKKKTTTDENIVTDIAKKLKAVAKTLTENA